MRNILLISLGVLLTAVLMGCGGGETTIVPENPGIQTADPPVPLTEAGPGAAILRNASGAPTGIRLTWDPVDDSADGGTPIAGYHVYRAAALINDGARGNQSLWVEIGGSTLIPQSAMPEPITVDDMFPVAVGETWHYRLSTVAEDGDESKLSPAIAVLILDFTVTDVVIESAGIGEQVTVVGRNFGQYSDSTDAVRVPGVEWQDGVGFVSVMLDAEITEWTADRISFNVPIGATRGNLEIQVNGESVETSEEFVNSDPYIHSINRLQGTILDTVVLGGANFGGAPGADRHLVFHGQDYTSAENYLDYTDTELTFHPIYPGSFGVDSFYYMYELQETIHGSFNLLNADPVAYLMAEPDSGPDPLLVRLTPAQSDGNDGLEFSYDPEGDLRFYRYDIGNDGSVEHELNVPTPVDVTLTPGGIHQIRLEVEDGEGATDAKVIAIQVDGVPEAVLTAEPTAGEAPFEVSFDASGSSDPDGTIDDYEWDFDGDGVFNEPDNDEIESRGLASTSANYVEVGDFLATVRVTDNDGYQATASQLIDSGVAPEASLDADPDEGTIPFTVSFDASASTDADGTIVDYEWDFDGDGLFNEADNGEGTARGDDLPAFEFTEYGDFDPAVRVTDDDGYQDTDSFSIFANSGPTAVLSADPLIGTIPVSISFDATGSFDPDGSIVDFEWDFDGNGTFNEAGVEADSRGSQVPKFSYDWIGTVTAAVRVTDDFGAMDIDGIEITLIPEVPFREDWEDGIAPGGADSQWQLQGANGSRSLDWITANGNRLLDSGAGQSSLFAWFESVDLSDGGSWHYGDNVNREMLAGPVLVEPNAEYFLSFYLAGFSEGADYDYLRVSYSWDGTNWKDIEDGADQYGDEWRYGGDTLGYNRWVNHKEVFQATSSEFYLRILFISDNEADGYDGPCIDEILLMNNAGV